MLATCGLELEAAREALTREGAEDARVSPAGGQLATRVAVAASLVAVMALAAAGLLWRNRIPVPNVSPVMRFEMLLPAGVELFGAANRPMAISPDGTRVAFVGVAGGGRRVYVRPLEKVEALPIAGSEDAFRCFFSPDGRSIALITATGVLKTISLADGAVATLTDGVTFLEGAAWSPDGSILFVRGGALWRIPQSGGTPEALTTLGGAKDDSLHSWPTASLDGKTVLFTAASAAGNRIEALVPSTGERRTVVEDAAMPLLVSEGRIVYFRGSDLLTATFEAEGLRLVGPERRVLENLPDAYSGTLAADVSRSGAIIYSSGNTVSQLAWVSRQGVETMLNEEFRSYSNPRLSPDGARLVVQAGDLWIQDLSRATFTRLVPGDPLATGYPQWTPDGRRVVFKTRTGLSVVDARGVGSPEAVAGTSISDYPGSVSLDGNTVVINRTTATSSFDVYSVPLRGQSNAALLVSTKAFDSGARLSPDGRWLTYVSNESGAFEVYLRPFDSSSRRWQVSTQGGTQAVWNPNSREIFYRSGNKMMAVELSTSPDVVLSPPRALFERRYGFGPAATMPNYDVSSDGQRFVMVKNEPLAERLNIVVNWFANGLEGSMTNRRQMSTADDDESAGEEQVQ